MVRSLERVEKLYKANKLTGLIEAFEANNITENQLRGHFKRFMNVDESVPISDVILNGKKVIADILKA